MHSGGEQMDTHDDEAMVGSTVETGPASHAVKTSAAEDSLKIYDAEADVAGACEEIMTLRKIAACRHIVRSEKILEERKTIVDWIAQLAYEFDFDCLTVHMAVDYLDRVTSSRDFRSGMLPLVAASCLLVAAKYEEGAEKIPSLSELLAAMGTPQSLTRRHLAACELEVLWLLGWTLRCATRLHFFRAFRALGLSSSQDVLEHSPPTRQEHDYMADLAKFFCDLAAQHPEFASYDHELAAAAAIAAARNATGIRPVWPKELSVRFGFSGNDVASCCGDLLGKYALAFPVRLGYVVALPESYPCSCDAPQTAPAESSCSYSPTNVAEPLSFLVSK